jgi:predicted esterase
VTRARASAVGLGLSALAFACACSAGTVVLGDEGCKPVDTLMRDGFDAPAPSDPSLGTGGATGDLSLTVDIPLWPTSEVYVHVPASYTPTRAWPVVLALHGASGSHDLAVDATAQLRGEWGALADQYGFIVVAPVGIGSQGSWFQPDSPNDKPTDYDVFAAALAQVEAAWNVERTRVYGWGFSAGGHVMHDLVVRGYIPSLDATHLAGYGVDAGVLKALACSGLTTSSCGTLRLAPMARRIPVAIEIGKSDTLLPYARSDKTLLLDQGWKDGISVFYREFTGGHQYTSNELSDIWRHLCRYGVVP